jgi:hypothetical protein
MKRFSLRQRLAIRLLSVSATGLALGGCVTDLQTRDFFQSTAIRVFWQSIFSVIQAGVIDAFGATSDTTTG